METPGAITVNRSAFTSKAHWLPCKVNEDASISRAEFDSLVSDEDPCTMSLRGRCLKGHCIVLPDGYIGLQITQQPTEAIQACGASDRGRTDSFDDTEMDKDEGGPSGYQSGPGGGGRRQPGKKWEATRSFSSVMLWGHDQPSTRSDATRRMLEYLSIASKVHATVSKDQVDALTDNAE
jgi:hypothetical protein